MCGFGGRKGAQPLRERSLMHDAAVGQDLGEAPPCMGIVDVRMTQYGAVHLQTAFGNAS